ncbi:Transducin beta-like protein 2 [Oopsacas minuta]|uniref:Transducin beta-like protein 2 n=1 Tax=Oopsacas minuta TaxID=111878 RepID=A0AAV7JEX3_9METZ|nr:Transducin beta-like protein 2 [Oopsacas minuta]
MTEEEVDLVTFIIDFLSSKETIGFLCGFIMSVGLVVWFVLPRHKKVVEEVEQTIEPVVKKRRKQQEQGLSRKQLLKLVEGKKLEIQFSHPSLAGHLRGHQDNLTDLSFDDRGRYLVTASQDRSIRIWYSKDFSTNDHRYARASIQLDFALKVRISPDCKALLAYTNEARHLNVYRLNKNSNGNITTSYAGDFPLDHKGDLISLDVASLGTYILAGYSEGRISVYSVKGKQLYTRDLGTIITVVVLSPSSERFFIGTPEGHILLFTIKLTESSYFHSMSFECNLKGHTKGIRDLAISGDTTRLASLGGDGKWIIWDTMKSYTDKAIIKPYIAQYEYAKAPPPLSASAIKKGKKQEEIHGYIAISPDTHVTVVIQKSLIRMFKTIDGSLLETIESTEYDEIDRVCFSPDGHYLITMSSVNEENLARIWYNPHGLQMELVLVERQLHGERESYIRDRLNKRVEEIKGQLRELSNKKKVKSK